MEQGDPAAALHGSSGYDSWTGEPGFNPLEYYVWRNGQMHNGLTVAAFQLVDVHPGDGGLGVIPCAPLLFALDAVSQTAARTPLLQNQGQDTPSPANSARSATGTSTSISSAHPSRE